MSWLIIIMVVFVFTVSKKEIVDIIKSTAAAYELPWQLIMAISWQESLLDPNAEGDDCTAIGVMQMSLATAEWLMGRPVSVEQLKNPVLNIDLGCRYVRHQMDRYDQDMYKAVAAYNAGSFIDKGNGEAVNDLYTRRVLNVFNALSALS